MVRKNRITFIPRSKSATCIAPDENDLFSLMTIPEAAAAFYVSPSTIRYHLERGRLRYRKAGQMILIARESLESLWGKLPNHWPECATCTRLIQ